MIVLGGGVVEALDDTFIDNIRAAAEKNMHSPNTLNGVQIVRAELGDNSGILGAAALARQRFFKLLTLGIVPLHSTMVFW